MTVLESRPRLGGRAGSFLDKQSGEWIDTCQHVAMGCCTNLRHFCRTLGIEDLFRTEDELTFIDPAGRRSHLTSRSLPTPLHLRLSIDRAGWSDWREQHRLVRDLRRLAHPRWAKDRGLSLLDWLQQEGTTLDLRERFWDPVLVSALSESLDRIAVPYARKVIVDGFLTHREGWRVQIPCVPLDELYGASVHNWLTSHSAQVLTNSGVTALELAGDAITAVRLRSGERLTADEFILGVPWYRMLELLPESLREHPQMAGIVRLQSAPISSVHLWFDRPVLDVPHAVLTGRLSQWVFRKRGERRVASDTERGAVRGAWGVEGGKSRAESREHGAAGAESEGTISQHIPRHSPLPSPDSPLPTPDYVQVVISASRGVSDRPSAEVIADVIRELADVWPDVKSATLEHARLVTEHRSVFSPVPGVDECRPLQQSPVGNLQLAGDWTRTGWPATMEGAVRSGYLAAANVLERLGQPEPLLQPDLPASRLARWMLGLKDTGR